MRRLATLLILATISCGTDGGADDEPDRDGGVQADAARGGCTELPALSPGWLAELTEDAVARLSGARPIRAGVTLPDRSTDLRRGEARDFLVAQLEAAGLEVLLDDYGGGTNAYAEIAATEGEATSWLVLGAHFDGVEDSPAANDNATGVAVVLAAARYVAELDCRRRGVVIAFLDQEEIGLVGSVNFANLLTASGLAIDSVHTVDQMGWDMDGDRVVELELPGAGMAQRYQAAASEHALDVGLTTTVTSSSDHQAFRVEGFTAVGLTEEYVSGDTTPHYHLPGDTYATIDFGYLESTAALVHAVVGGFAVGAGEAARSSGTGSGGALDRLRWARAHRQVGGPVAGWIADPRAGRPR